MQSLSRGLEVAFRKVRFRRRGESGAGNPYLDLSTYGNVLAQILKEWSLILSLQSLKGTFSQHFKKDV